MTKNLFPPLKVSSPGAPGNCCAGCIYWQNAFASPTPQGVCAPCHRYPPTVALAPNLKFLAGLPTFSPTILPCPLTPQDFWCGEFARSTA